MGDGGRGEGHHEKGSKKKQQQKKQTAVLRDIESPVPRMYKEPWVLSAKATLPTYCDGSVGISLLLVELFSQLKTFNKDFFSTVLLLRNSMFMQGKMYFLKSILNQRDSTAALGTA